MFCPKCGEQIPDDSTFCGKCGNKIGAKVGAGAVPAPAAANVKAASGKAAGGASLGGFSGMRIAAIIVSAVAIIFALLPWLETSTFLQGLGAAGSSLGYLGSAVTGHSYNVASFDETYSVFGFMGLASGLSSYSSSSPSGILMVFFFVWLAAILVFAIGLVVMLATQKHSKVALMVGAILMVVVSLIWVMLYGSLVSAGYAAGSPTNAILCMILSIAAVVLAGISKKQAA